MARSPSVISGCDVDLDVSGSKPENLLIEAHWPGIRGGQTFILTMSGRSSRATVPAGRAAGRSGLNVFSRSSRRCGCVGSQPGPISCGAGGLVGREDGGERAVRLRNGFDQEPEPPADDRGDVMHGVALVVHGAMRSQPVRSPGPAGRARRRPARAPRAGAGCRRRGSRMLGAARDAGQQASDLRDPGTSMPWAGSSTICARRQVTTAPLPRRIIRISRRPSSSDFTHPQPLRHRVSLKD